MPKTGVTEEQAISWFDDLGVLQGQRFVPGSPAWPIKAVGAHPQDNGMVLRLVLPDGKSVDLFLNAVVARGLLFAIPECGRTGGWLDASDDIIIQAPEGPRRWAPQA